MKTTFQKALLRLIISCCLVCGLHFDLDAQDTNVDWDSASDAQVIFQAIELTTPVPSNDVPDFATYYSAQHLPFSAEPWPPLPANVENLSGWDLGSNIWVLDDLGFDYDALSEPANRPMMAMDEGGIFPPGADNTNTFYPAGSSPIELDPGTNLWIAQETVLSNNFSGILSNTLPDVEYQLLSANSLDATQWISQGFIMGSETTNWTPWSLPYSPTNNFFLNALSWQDSSDSGIPDWWWLKYFGQDTNVDSFADPVGDGYSLYEDYINGWVPTNWMEPPAPQGLTIDSFNSASNTATLTWLPSSGPVTGYTIQTPNGTIPLGNVTTYNDNESSANATYSVEADYVGGTSVWSNPVSVGGDPAPDATIVPGPEGNLYLVASSLPSDLAAILIFRDSWDSGGPISDMFQLSGNYLDQGNFPSDPLAAGSFQIPASGLTNGICVIPSADVTPFFPYTFQIETVRSNGVTSLPVTSGLPYASVGPLSEVPFIDGRTDFKDNLRFLLRAGDDARDIDDNPQSFQFINDENSYFGFRWPSDHICVGFYSDGGGYYGAPYILSNPDALEPLEDNIFYKNFVFDENNLTNTSDGDLITPNTGVTYQYGPPGEPEPVLTYAYGGVKYSLNVSAFLSDPAVPTSAISPGTSAYIPPATFEAGSIFNEYFSETGDTNIYGLPFVADEGVWTTNGDYYYETLYPKQITRLGWPFPDAEQPGFQIINYYFCRPGFDQMPEKTDFSATNITPLIIVPVGGQQPLYGDAWTQLAGYAQLAITNGYPGVYGYIGQYFINAYEVDATGKATTNTTGILSPYGQFFATEPGPAALVTMPDVDTGEQGTCMVYCVSINMDKNHDGVMDASWNGPDATSQLSPMEFWVNDGCDAPNTSPSGGLDRDLQVPPNPPNYAPSQFYPLGHITCARDLENFARLWICGVPALPTNGNYQVTLSWNNVSGNPAINLYNSIETNGGTGYLTDMNIAAEQCSATTISGGMNPYSVSFVGPDVAIANITPSSSYTFPTTNFLSSGNQYFLFEGAGIGSGELEMTVYQNSNVVAQTGVWLDLHDIKDYYERAVINGNMNGEISNWTSSVEYVQQAISSIGGTDTNLIVMVHGINVGNWEWLDDSDTVFKRLYWSGFDGQFSTVKWPCNFLTPPQPISFGVFNLSEAKAYKASTALITYLNQLRSRFPGFRLNLYAHSQGNAIASEAIKDGAPVDNYLLTQGAITDGAYDVDATNYEPFLEEETNEAITPEWQPMGYQGVYTNLTSRCVNFYNPFDPVLAIWNLDQELEKPDYNYSYNGINCYYTSLLLVSSIVTDFQETRSMVSRARSLSIGTSGPDTAHGVIISGVNLNTQYNFDDDFPADHSAQWQWPIQTTLPYYQQVLRSYQIEPTP